MSQNDIIGGLDYCANNSFENHRVIKHTSVFLMTLWISNELLAQLSRPPIMSFWDITPKKQKYILETSVSNIATLG